MNSVIGDSPKRIEDEKFLTGSGKYLDDLEFKNICHAVFLRSPHAHARILSINTDIAAEMSGVLAVITADDVENGGLKSLRPFVTENPNTSEPFSFIDQPLLAREIVRYPGEPIVLIVGKTLMNALDAAEFVEIEYSILPHVIGARESIKENAPVIASEIDRNICVKWQCGTYDELDKIFESAHYVVDLQLNNHRIIANPMEPRGLVSQWDSASGRYTLYGSTQNIHVIRNSVADMLGVEKKMVRFIAPDVGGGFGSKNFCYTEYALIAWASKQVNQPVKWIASRSEVFLSDHQARDHQSDSRLALGKDGKFLALKITSYANLGAYMVGSSGGVQVVQYANLPGTVYNIPAIGLEIFGVLTNTTPIGVFRGPGYAESNLIMERLIDTVALQYDLDKLELRRLNMFQLKDMPFTNALGAKVDSGDFRTTFDKAIDQSDYLGFTDRKKETESKGLLRGFGFAYHIKGTGGSPDENVDIRFDKNETISLIMGTQTIGQGHETTFPQILASQIGVASSQIHLRESDTDLIPFGGGHGSSRSTYMGGTAIFSAVKQIISKGMVTAAEEFETAIEDIAFIGGRFVVKGTDKTLGVFEVAELSKKTINSLDTYYAWTRESMTFPNGAHVVEVEIDRETGEVLLQRYTAVDDYGVLVNPLIVTGQMHGAITQGIGQALLETVVYDNHSGQLLTGSFMDYALPRADDLPFYKTDFNNTRCMTNPLGVKGCGEAGTIAAPPAIANAIIDALSPFGITHFDGPATPARIWSLLQTVK